MISKFRKKKSHQRSNLFFSILLGILFLLVVAFLVVTDWRINQRRAKLTVRVAALREEVATLEQKNKELKENVSQAGGEEYLEQVARDQLSLKIPGEEVVVITEEETEEKKAVEEEKSWWEIIKSIWER